jgi:predicted dehydrogenase
MIRIGMIGTGGISNVHLRYLSNLDDVEITALCDIDEIALQKRHRQYGGRSYTDYNEMLEKEELGAVYLCTPPEVREEPLVACAERGLPVFCEKPVERTVEKARHVAAELAKRNARVQVGYPFRSMDTIRRLRDEIAADTIHLVQSSYLCDVSLRMSLPAWFYDKSRSGGGLVDQATHNLDLLRYLFGEVTEVKGYAMNPVNPKKEGYTIDETISLTMKFDSGVLGSHIHSWIAHGWQNTMYLSGEKAYYTLMLSKGVLSIARGSDTITFEQHAGSLWDFENAVFVEKLRNGTWSEEPSNYADAVKTLALTLTCNDVIEPDA